MWESRERAKSEWTRLDTAPLQFIYIINFSEKKVIIIKKSVLLKKSVLCVLKYNSINVK